MVERLGPSVDLVSNGVEAVSKATAEHYDLILMDMQMPEMDGIEATRKIRQLGVDIIEAGCNDFVAKPINSQKLVEVLTKYCTVIEVVA